MFPALDAAKRRPSLKSRIPNNRLTTQLLGLAVMTLALLLVQPSTFIVQSYLQLDQSDSGKSYVRIPDSSDLSVSNTGSMTVAVWMRPDTLNFKYTEGNGFVNWLGKGDTNGSGRDEWQFRMYNSSNSQNRVNRISFYVFNLTGGEGIGSYSQYPINTPDPVVVGEWIFVAGVVDGATNTTSIYKNGAFIRCDKFYGDSIASINGKTCQHYPRVGLSSDGLKTAWIVPKHGQAPLYVGRSDSCCPTSYLQGGISKVRIWGRALSSAEIQNLYQSDRVPQTGLVAQYLLDENSGIAAHDSVGGHDGSIVGTTWRWAASHGTSTTTPEFLTALPLVLVAVLAVMVMVYRQLPRRLG